MRELLRRFIGRIYRAKSADFSFGYFGTYSTWIEAKGAEIGYADPSIAERVSNAARQVAEGKAVYERDSVIFQERQYSFPVATALLWSATCNDGHLHVLDFGGGLGTSYFQNKPFFASLREVVWSIVEQPTFVEQGRKIFQDGRILFSVDLEEELSRLQPKVVLVSSTLQYVSDPYRSLNIFMNAGVDMIVVDRTLFSSDDHDVVTLQRVPENVFSATIPVWILSEKKFTEFVSTSYSIMARFQSSQSTVDWDKDKRILDELGFILVRNHSSMASLLELK